jgi:hypothetical protein
MLAVFCIFVLTGVAAAQEKPDAPPVTITRVECEFVTTSLVISFGEDPSDLVPVPCGDNGMLPTWMWGVPVIIPPPPDPYGPNVWGTIIGGDYSNETGEGLISPPILVEIGVNDLIELVHYVDIETSYDGGNVLVIDEAQNETILIPIGGYPDDEISDSPNYYAWCVDGEPGFTGHENVWTYACADLSPWAGQLIQIRHDFGSDSSVTYPGWYLAGVVFGSSVPVPTEESSWGRIKTIYR